MNVERMTLRVQQALNDANLIAVKYSHQQIDVIHLFAALVEADDGLIPNIFTKMGINVKMMRVDIKNALERFKEKAGNLPTKLVIKSHESGNNSNTEIPENYTEYTVEYKIASTNQ